MNWKRTLLWSFLLALAAYYPLAAQESAEWTVDDILLAERADGFQISPDGQWAVWVTRRMDKEKGEQISNLWMSHLTENKTLQLTRGKATHSNPRWSPDGSLLAFQSTRPLPEKEADDEKHKPASSQLWAMNPFGGEPWPLTRLERSLRAYEWQDTESIVFAAEEDLTRYERTIQEEKDTSRVVEDEAHSPPVRLFQLQVEGKKIERLTGNDDWIDRLAVSPDGRWAVTRHQRSLRFQYDNEVLPVTFLTDLGSGEQTQIFEESRILPSSVEWSRDSKGFYVAAPYSNHPKYFQATIDLLYYFDLASRQHRQVDLDWEAGLGFSGPEATGDGFIALLAAGVRFKPARYVKEGTRWTRTFIEGEHQDNLFGWALGEDGTTLVYDYSTASRPSQWYRARLDGARIGDAVQVTDLNPSFEAKSMPRAEMVSWTGAREETVDGVLHYPLDYTEGQKYPLILMIHGGPTGVDMDRWTLGWSRPITPLTQKGAFIFRVNYHGSGNYPLEWVESIGGGNYYDLEIPDIEAGVDHLIGRGLVDPDKLATMGWSNGAILSSELVTRNPRYKACSAGAGDIEWISDWGNVDFGAAFDNYYFGASPLEDPELYVRKSPFFRLMDVTAPTILFTGTEDRNVPPSQSWSHYRALQQIGKTEVKLVLFPGEPHGLRKLVHQKRKVEEELVWFDRHLFGTYEEPNEAFKEGSPLDMTLKRSRFQKVEGNYGTEVRGALIPEVVTHQGLELGRFEVTRAQYAAFDKPYRFEPGTENYPASGLSLGQARAYCAWLSQRTGDTYRLAGESEVEAIYDTAAEGKENTLDYWAGYAPNTDDAGRLALKIAELPGAAPLLKEGGRFEGRGKDPVFDLGGNVAEWIIGPDGAGKLIGGSADRPADSKAATGRASEAYRGFRVVKGQAKN